MDHETLAWTRGTTFAYSVLLIVMIAEVQFLPLQFAFTCILAFVAKSFALTFAPTPNAESPADPSAPDALSASDPHT